jgi:toxin ParE1/3/4
MSKISWTLSAQIDLQEIAEYIALDSKKIPLEKVDLIQAEVSRLKKFAKQGRIIPELERISVLTYQELILHPWRIMYRAERETMYIVAVIDGRRNVEDILLRRNIR